MSATGKPIDLDLIEARAETQATVETAWPHLEAGAAALRKVAEQYIAEHGAIEPWEWEQRFGDALTIGAGKALLDRLEEVEGAAGAFLSATLAATSHAAYADAEARLLKALGEEPSHG